MINLLRKLHILHHWTNWQDLEPSDPRSGGGWFDQVRYCVVCNRMNRW